MVRNVSTGFCPNISSPCFLYLGFWTVVQVHTAPYLHPRFMSLLVYRYMHMGNGYFLVHVYFFSDRLYFTGAQLRHNDFWIFADPSRTFTYNCDDARLGQHNDFN